MDGTAMLWDLQSRSARLTLKGHTAPVHHAIFAQNGSRVVTASRDRTLKVLPPSYPQRQEPVSNLPTPTSKAHSTREPLGAGGESLSRILPLHPSDFYLALGNSRFSEGRN